MAAFRHGRLRAEAGATALLLALVLVGATAPDDVRAEHAGGGVQGPLPGATAVEAALAWSSSIPTNGSVTEVLIGRDDVFADNLAAGGLQRSAPLLLTPPGALDSRVAAEIERLGATRITILGSEGAISQAVEQDLRELSTDVVRLAGGARWDTAIEIARASGASTAILARAFDADGGSGSAAWADSLAAGAWAAAAGYAVLLTPTDQLVPSVAEFLAEGQIDEVLLVGGDAALAPHVEDEVAALVPATRRIAGPVRTATAVAIAGARTGAQGAPRQGAILVDGFGPLGWAGGFPAAFLAAHQDLPVVLTDGAGGALAPETARWLAGRSVRTLVCGPFLQDALCGAAAELVSFAPPGALAPIAPLPSARGSLYEGTDYSEADRLFAYEDARGDLAVVGVDVGREQFTVETFDAATFAPIGDAVTVSYEGWPRWGSLLAAPDGSVYVLVGRDNDEEEDDRGVVAVRRYDADWELTDTAFARGGIGHGLKGIASPFEASAPDLLLVDDRLVVHMGRSMYTAEDGLRHQGNVTFEVDTDTMTASSFEELGDITFSSHSFRQLLASVGDDLVLVDHGDTFPRAVQLGVMADYPDERAVATYEVFPFNGPGGNTFTGAAITGIASGPSDVLVVGSSIAHPDAPNGPLGAPTDARNIFVTTTEPRTGVSDVRWLTDFPATGGPTASEPRIVQVAPDAFAVLYSVVDDGSVSTAYRLVDGAGEVQGSADWPGVWFSPVSDPVLAGDVVHWAGFGVDGHLTTPAQPYLFGLDVSDPTAPELLGG